MCSQIVPASSLVLLTVAVLVVVNSTTHAHAMPENPCTNGWSANGTYASLSCSFDSSIDWLLGDHWPLLLPVALGAILFFPVFPVFYLGRYLCGVFGSSQQRPDHCCSGGSHWDVEEEDVVRLSYAPSGVRATRFGTISLVVFPVAFISLAYVGGTSILNDIDKIVDGGHSLFTWIRSDVDHVGDVLSPTGTEAAVFEEFFETKEKIRRDLNHFEENSVNSDHLSALKRSVSAIAFPTIAPAACFFLAAIAAALHLRTCVPMSIVAVLFVLNLFVGAATSTVLLVRAGVGLACEEGDAQLARTPGIFQNYLVPQCHTSNPFRSVLDSMDDMSARLAQSTCDAFLEACDATTTATVARPFYCVGGPRCTTLAEVEALHNSTRLKTDAPNPCGGAVDRAACTWAECAATCAPNHTARVAAGEGVSGLEHVRRVRRALNSSEALRTMSNCDTFFDHVLRTLDVCVGLPASLSLVSTACIVMFVGDGFLIVLLVLGSKRFFPVVVSRSSRSRDMDWSQDMCANLNAVVVLPRSEQQQQHDPYDDDKG